MNTSNNIRRFRVKREMMQIELAEKIGVTPSTVSLWETGARIPQERNIRMLCKALNVSREKLFPTYSGNEQMSINETVGKKPYARKNTNGLKDLRERAGLTTRQVEEKINVSKTTISEWENGKRNVTASAYRPLCELYNVTLEELLDAATNRPVEEEYQPKTSIEAARLRAGKSIEECAEYCGTDADTYLKFEDGILTVSISGAIRLAKYLGIEDFTEFESCFAK